ncbi:MAG: triphosphoribosyl-dephospho-CoA synthase CitG [Pyramidobacter sp.]|jgi:holo-ACP synthase/triphosphoribosyl-dephospho-CoA synthase
MNVDKILNARPVSLQQVLAARERRVERQKAMLAGGADCLVSCTLNMPGEVKQFPLARAFFLSGLNRLTAALARASCVVERDQRFLSEDTGCEAFFALRADPRAVKALTCALEESSAAARLFDFDVLDGAGRKISRSELGLGERRCLVCGRPVSCCARSRAHSAGELSRTAARLMYGHMAGTFAENVAAAASRALLYEVCVSPKPGLVDRFNTGAHDDMDFYSFLDSACALRPYFRRCVLLGAEKADLPPVEVFKVLRFCGMEAEEAMFAATGGVNVHKGAIFSFGLICASRGRLWGLGEKAAPERLAQTAQAMAQGIFDDFRPDGATAGQRAFREAGVTGVRGEAAAGFPSALNVGLPTLEGLLRQGKTMDAAAGATLLHLLAVVDDTNMIKRSSAKRFREVQKEIKSMLSAESCPDAETLAALDRRFIAERLSPGGCADMLALALFFHFLRKFEDEKAPSLP